VIVVKSAWFRSVFIKSWLYINLFTFVTLWFRIGLLIFCALLTSNFIKSNASVLILVSIPLAAIHPRYGMKSLLLSKLLLQ